MPFVREKRDVDTGGTFELFIFINIFDQYYYGFLWLFHSNLNFRRGPHPNYAPGSILTLDGPVYGRSTGNELNFNIVGCSTCIYCMR